VRFLFTTLSRHARFHTLRPIQWFPATEITSHLNQKASYKCALFCAEILTVSSTIPLTSIQFMQSINCILFHLKERITESNSMDRILLQKLTATRLLKKLVAIYGPRFYITPPRETLFCHMNPGHTFIPYIFKIILSPNSRSFKGLLH
jgi:hypothetical protein